MHGLNKQNNNITIIWDVLRCTIFKKVKNTHGGMLLLVKLLKLVLIDACFSRFLNCKNDTKLHKALNVEIVTHCNTTKLTTFLMIGTFIYVYIICYIYYIIYYIYGFILLSLYEMKLRWKQGLTLIENQASLVHIRISHAHIKSIAPPIHAECTAAITGCRHFSATLKDSCKPAIIRRSSKARRPTSASGSGVKLPMKSMRSKPKLKYLKSQQKIGVTSIYVHQTKFCSKMTIKNSVFGTLSNIYDGDSKRPLSSTTYIWQAP